MLSRRRRSSGFRISEGSATNITFALQPKLDPTGCGVRSWDNHDMNIHHWSFNITSSYTNRRCGAYPQYFPAASKLIVPPAPVYFEIAAKNAVFRGHLGRMLWLLVLRHNSRCRFCFYISREIQARVVISVVFSGYGRWHISPAPLQHKTIPPRWAKAAGNTNKQPPHSHLVDHLASNWGEKWALLMVLSWI